MPHYQQTLSVQQHSSERLLPLAYGTFAYLGWTTELATEDRLVGCTKKKWGRPYDHIIAEAAGDTLTVTSKLPEDTAWDLFRKNKKNAGKFADAFATIQSTATASELEEWSSAIASLQEQTAITLEKEEQERAEAEAVMNFSTGSKSITYILMGLNVALFVTMIAAGVHFFEPQTADLLKWGANYKPLTTGGEWWRLFTATFIHIGLIHLLFNMYALYQAGIYLEPMLGRQRFLTAYLCTGILASLCSTWWHGSEIISAGASGAIFGLYGVFLALLTTRLIPPSVRKALLQSIGVFVVYNLLYGVKSKGVDNAAHLGGFISGFAVGYLYFLTFRRENVRPAMVMASMGAVTVLLSFMYLKAAQNDGGLYTQKVDEVILLEKKAMAPFQSYANDADLLSKLARESQVEWLKAKAIMDETEKYNLDENLIHHRKLLKEYVDLRSQYNDLAIIALQGKENVDGELEELNKQIEAKLAQMMPAKQ